MLFQPHFFKKKLLFIFILMLLCIIEFVLIYNCIQIASGTVHADLDESLIPVVEHLINQRNKAILTEDSALLESMYNKKIRASLYAYEHEMQKMEYLHEWEYKQGITFLSVESVVVLRSSRKINDAHNVNLLVSTEYKYIYNSDPTVTNTFRIGTYHYLNVKQTEQNWMVMREWYTDPFADSLALDGEKSEEIRQIIQAAKLKDYSNLPERRKKAVAYADQYCGAANTEENGFKYNTKYRNFNPEGGDCANFASQILFEGGSFRKNGTWNYSGNSGSRAWLNASGFNSYMRNSGRASLIASGSYSKVLKLSYNLLPGDYIAYEKKGDVKHISVVTGQDSKGYPLVNCHNTDRYRVPWDLGWNSGSIRFHLVRVHY